MSTALIEENWQRFDADLGRILALVGAIVGELPTGAVAGLGARLLTGSYFGLTIQIWSALVMAAIMASILIAVINIVTKITLNRMGMQE